MRRKIALFFILILTISGGLTNPVQNERQQDTGGLSRRNGGRNGRIGGFLFVNGPRRRTRPPLASLRDRS